jgi:hypothetical protein
MKALRLVPLAILMFFALSAASVFGSGYAIGVPLLGTTGNPALASPSLFSGVITVLYPDGAPVVLETNHIFLDLCASNCITVHSTLKQTSPGAYTYTFSPPSSLAGSVTIYVAAGSLADDNGRIFPSVDTSIGTYAFTPSSSQSTLPSSNSANAPQQNFQSAPSPSNSESRQAVNEAQSIPAQQASTVETPMALALAILSVVGCFLILPTRH